MLLGLKAKKRSLARTRAACTRKLAALRLTALPNLLAVVVLRTEHCIKEAGLFVATGLVGGACTNAELEDSLV